MSIDQARPSVRHLALDPCSWHTISFAPEIDSDPSVRHRAIVQKIIDRVQHPHHYGPTFEEQERIKHRELLDNEKRDRERHEENQRQQQETVDERTKKQKEWTRKLEQIKREEFDLLEVQATPLRNYLMAHVMPTVTKALKGLLFTCRVRRGMVLFSSRVLSSAT